MAKDFGLGISIKDMGHITESDRRKLSHALEVLLEAAMESVTEHNLAAPYKVFVDLTNRELEQVDGGLRETPAALKALVKASDSIDEDEDIQ